MIINNKIKELVRKIDEESSIEAANRFIKELIQKLSVHCQKAENQEKYSSYSDTGGVLGEYPIDSDGYARSFDPLENEEEFYSYWSKFGIVVGSNVIPNTSRIKAIERINELMLAISNGACDFNRPDTWANIPVDAAKVPFLSRGFFEVYQDSILADLRQSVHLYIHHVIIWGRTDLWTSFDRLGVKLPEHKDSKGLPLHVDQNPTVHPGFKTIQGVLALTDCPIERGTYVGVPGSKKYFLEYARMAEGKGEYVELYMQDEVATTLRDYSQVIPLRAGDIVSWDSRTTHANSENVSNDIRMVAYIAAGPAREDKPELIEERLNAFKTGAGKNVREALMHASKPPRYTSPVHLQRVRKQEQLTLLGELLYGQKSYRSI